MDAIQLKDFCYTRANTPIVATVRWQLLGSSRQKRDGGNLFGREKMLKEMTLMTVMAMSYQNAPYKWAANGPFEFDCSGYALRVLRDVGIPLPDMCAKDIYKWALKNGFSSSFPDQDCLLFFGKSSETISHVGIGFSSTHMFEAGGAGRDSLTLTIEELSKKNARVRPGKIRKDLYACIKVRY